MALRPLRTETLRDIEFPNFLRARTFQLFFAFVFTLISGQLEKREKFLNKLFWSILKVVIKENYADKVEFFSALLWSELIRCCVFCRHSSWLEADA